MLISSHDLIHVTEVAQRVVLLEKGKVVMDQVKDAATFGQLEKYFMGISELHIVPNRRGLTANNRRRIILCLLKSKCS